MGRHQNNLKLTSAEKNIEQCVEIKKILTVDDSSSLRKMVVSNLTVAGHQVTEASDEVNRLAKAKSEVFDFGLTDKNMSRMNGLMLIKSLCTLSNY